MKIEVDDELIVKFLSGEASPEEAMALHDWLQNPVNQFHFNGLQKAWNASYPGKSPHPVNVEKAWNRMVQIKGDAKQKQLPRNSFFAPRTFLKVAASVVFLLALGAVIYLLTENKKVDEIVIETHDSIQHVNFTDQTKVALFRNSSLQYPETFGKQREVHLLKGEAFFQVASDPAKPFLVHTRLATVKVLGTAFNVMSRTDQLEISVDQGRVLVYTTSDSVYLNAGEAASLQPVTNHFVIHQSNSNVWSYATHKYVFNNTSLAEVFDYVEKAQNCEIRTSDTTIGNCKLTATFESVSTEYMLTLITEALNLSVIKHDDHTFTVEGEGCH